MSKRWQFTKEEISWVLYDIGNSAFVLVVITTIMPIFFKDVVAQDLEPTLSTAYWGYANASGSLLLALLAPLLGTFADYRDTKKILLVALIVMGVVLTGVLSQVGVGDWLFCLIVFAFARVCWAGANVIYDAFLVDVTSKEKMDNVSAHGYGWGYIGSVVPFLIIMGLIFTAMNDESPLPVEQTQWSFIIVAIWWLLFSIPLMRKVKQRYGVDKPASPFRATFKQIWSTLKKIRHHRQVFLFLLAYFFYIDGVDTIISMAAVYGRDLNFTPTMLITVILFIQIVAFPFALVFSRLASYFSSKKLLLSGIAVYVVTTVLAFSIPSVPDSWRVPLFWFIAFLIASSMGGIQAISRSYFAKIIPPENSGEFFGFYNIVGRFAAIVGPIMLGVVGTWMGHSKWGVLSLLILFLVGAWFLTKVEEPKSQLN